MAAENRQSRVNKSKPKILIADDEVVVRDLFARFLIKQGFEVSTAEDGDEAFNKIKEDHFDMLIMDLRMPKISGMELLNKIEEFKKDLIIIVITGYATVETAKQAIKQGCFDYVTKPFDIEDVNIIIKRAFEMRQLAQQKKKLQEQLEIAEKLAMLAEMGAAVVHEVNTVLTSTKLFLEMIKSRLSQTEQDSNIGLILEEIGRAENLIRRFLDFAKPEAPEFIRTDINNIIKKSVQFFRQKVDKQKIEVVEDLNQDIPKILCDPANMEEVFLNIFSNSIDSMPEGGNLSIKSEVIDTNLAITISDTGTGIPSKNLTKVYNPFFTTKPHGTGLGLSIVHRIIDEHKGLIFINSVENRGTAVRIELPIL